MMMLTLVEKQKVYLTGQFFYMRSTLISATLLILLSCTNTPKAKPVSYQAGYTTIRGIDSSRTYKPGTDSSDYLHFRTLDLDIWYPAENSLADSIVLFKDFLGLLEQRANYYTASTAATGVPQVGTPLALMKLGPTALRRRLRMR